MVCLTFPIARPDIFWVSPEHTAAALSLPGPAACQTSAAGIAAGMVAAVGAWDMTSEDAGQAQLRAQREESPAGWKTSFSIAPALFQAPAQHILEQDQIWVPTLPKSPVHGLHLPSVCSCPKILWEWGVMGLWRGTDLQPCPTFSPCKSPPETHQSSLGV